MSPENPERLWAYLAPAAERSGAREGTDLRVFASGDERRMAESRAIAASSYLDGRVSPVQAYVREDIVSADVESLAATWRAWQATMESETAALRQESAAAYERGKATAMANLAETGDMCDRAQDERDALRLEKAALVAERDALRAERDRLARLGWAAITTIRAMSEIGSASFFGRLAEDAALDGDLSEGRQCNATRMTHLNEADRLDDIVKAVLADDEAAAPSGKGVG